MPYDMPFYELQLDMLHYAPRERVQNKNDTRAVDECVARNTMC